MPSPGGDRSQTAPQMLTAPGERRIVGGGEVEAHHPEQGVQEPFGLAQREMVEEPQGQGGLDDEIRVPPLPAPPAAPAGCPGRDRLRGHPHRPHRRVERGPGCRPPQFATRYFALYVGWTFDFIPVVWLLRRVTRSAGQTAPPPQGIHATTPAHGVAHRLSGGRRADSLPARLPPHRRPQPDPRQRPRAGRHAADRPQEPRHLRPLQHHPRAGTARTPGTSSSSIWRSRRRRPAGARTRQEPPPRAPRRPSALCDAPPRKGAGDARPNSHHGRQAARAGRSRSVSAQPCSTAASRATP